MKHLAAMLHLLLPALAQAADHRPAWLDQIHAAEAHARVLPAAPTVLIGVIDAGFRISHAVLAPALAVNPGEIAGNGIDDDGNGFIDDVSGWNMLGGSPRLPVGNHGTMVAGALALAGGPGIRLVPCHAVASQLKDGRPGQIAKALDYLRQRGARIINMSLASEPDPELTTALRRCRDAGILVVIAAGNSGVDIDNARLFWDDADNIVVVGGVDDLGRSAHLNSGNSRVHLAAPAVGLRLPGSKSDDAWVTETGTSFAAPQVAAALALLIRAHPADDHRSIVSRLLHGTRPEPSLLGRCRSGGVLDMAAALTADALPAINDRRESAWCIRPGGVRAAASLWGASPDPGLPDGSWLWWRWRCPGTTTARLAVSGTDARILVLDPDGHRLGGGSACSFTATSGAAYDIAAHAQSGADGEVSVRLECDPPPNDRLAGAIQLPAALPVRQPFCNTWARGDGADPWVSFDNERPAHRQEPPEMLMQDRQGRELGRMRMPPPAHPLWYSWRSAASGTVRISVADVDHPAGFEVLSRTSEGWRRLGMVPGIRDAKAADPVEIPLGAGETIHIVVAVAVQPEMWQMTGDGRRVADCDSGLGMTGCGTLVLEAVRADR